MCSGSCNKYDRSIATNAVSTKQKLVIVVAYRTLRCIQSSKKRARLQI